jgi:hypothetical protein
MRVFGRTECQWFVTRQPSQGRLSNTATEVCSAVAFLTLKETENQT